MSQIASWLHSCHTYVGNRCLNTPDCLFILLLHEVFFASCISHASLSISILYSATCVSYINTRWALRPFPSTIASFCPSVSTDKSSYSCSSTSIRSMLAHKDLLQLHIYMKFLFSWNRSSCSTTLEEGKGCGRGGRGREGKGIALLEMTQHYNHKQWCRRSEEWTLCKGWVRYILISYSTCMWTLAQ